MNERHELFDELDAFDPRWQTTYPTLWKAARAAGCLDLYNEFIVTPEGKRLAETVRSLVDWTVVNEVARAQVQAERQMAARALAEQRRGEIIDWDRAEPEEE